MIHNPLFFSFMAHLSRILGIANKFIPIYKDIKPIASHLPDFLNKLSNINLQIKEKSNAIVNNTKSRDNLNTNNSPVFFK